MGTVSIEKDGKEKEIPSSRSLSLLRGPSLAKGYNARGTNG